MAIARTEIQRGRSRDDARGGAQQGVRMWSAGAGRSGTEGVPSPAEAGATFVVGGHVFDAPAYDHVGGMFNGLPSSDASRAEDGHLWGGVGQPRRMGVCSSFPRCSRGVFAKRAVLRYTTKKKGRFSRLGRSRVAVDGQAGQYQQLAGWLREELQEFTRVLRHRRDRASLLAAADRLRAAVQTAEAAVQDPRQRYQLPQEEQWGFVSVFAFVQEAKQELKQFPPPRV